MKINKLNLKQNLKMEQLQFLMALFAIFGQLSAAVEDNFDYTCNPGFSDSPGVTIPRGDIHVKEGSPPFPIYCHMNPNYRHYTELGLRSDSLEMILARNDSAIKLDATILNDTTIRVVYDPTNRIRDIIKCKINLGNGGEKRGICMQNIFTGEKPLPPEDFKCISENWKNLNCTWKEPFNPVKTTYSLSFVLAGRNGHILECPKNFYNGKRTPRSSCFLSLKTTPPFRQAAKYYQFVMHMYNALDKNGTTIPLPINSHAVVKPGPAQNISLIAVGSDRLKLHYKPPGELEYFAPGLRHRIRIKGQFDTKWSEIKSDKISPHSLVVDLRINGRTPYTQYSVEISLLSAAADPNDLRLWSEPVVIKSQTFPQIPGSPPKTALGSFEVVGGLQERRVYVYWQQIPEIMMNGPNFKYSVTEVFENDKISPLVPLNVSKAYAEFPHMSLQNYLVYVASQNVIGNSLETSQVFVPHHDKIRDLKPRSFTKIAYSETLFEVSWIAPSRDEDVESYTVFWCKTEDNRDRPYQCGGYLDWTDFSADVRVANISLPTKDIYQFAVAANTKAYSSGMIWATCTILHNKVVGKLKTVSIENVESKSMEIKWRLDCSDRVGIVTGYHITYCPIEDPMDTADCINGKEYSKITGPADESTFLEDLVPWTYYKVGVAVLTRAGESEISEYLVNRTDRGQPGSPPSNLKLTLERNKVEIRWRPPTLPNAPINFYQIKTVYVDFLNHKQTDVINSEGHSLVIKDLLYNQEYEIRVRACTITDNDLDLCSEHWAVQNFKTGIGKSGKMPTPLVKFQNSTELTVEWGHAYQVGGPIDHFDLNITHQRLGRSKIFPISGLRNKFNLNLENIVDDMDWTPDCFNNSVSNLYNLSVRAVTVDPITKQMFEGDWSPVEVTPAYCKSAIPWAIILSVVIPIPIIGVAMTIYFCGFCKKLGKESSHWVKVENMVIANSNQIGSDGNKKDGPQDIQHIHAVKKTSYPRATSKESSETLLSRDGKRNISGCSETSSAASTSSGCVSARSSDYADEKETAALAPSVEKEPQEVQAYVAFAGVAHGADEEAGKYINGYSHMGPGDVLQPRPGSPLSANNQIAPLGYSRVGQIREQEFDAGFDINDVPMSTSKTPGYVTFDKISASPATTNVSMDTSNPSSQGYITFAQANKPILRPPSNIPSSTSNQIEEQNLVSPMTTVNDPQGAYSKVGLNSSGYVPPAFLKQPQMSNITPVDSVSSGPSLSLKSNTLDWQQQRTSFSTGYSQVSNMSDNPQEQIDNPLRQKDSYENKEDLDRHQRGKPTNYFAQKSPSPGYVIIPDSPDNPSVLMSPKNLKVESKDPYSRAVTSVEGNRSTMV